MRACVENCDSLREGVVFKIRKTDMENLEISGRLISFVRKISMNLGCTKLSLWISQVSCVTIVEGVDKSIQIELVYILNQAKKHFSYYPRLVLLWFTNVCFERFFFSVRDFLNSFFFCKQELFKASYLINFILDTKPCELPCILWLSDPISLTEKVKMPLQNFSRVGFS